MNTETSNLDPIYERLLTVETELSRLRLMWAEFAKNSPREEQERLDDQDREIALSAVLCAAQAFETTPEVILSESRMYAASVPRHVARYLLHNIGWSSRKISRSNGKYISHSTVANSIEVVKGLSKGTEWSTRIERAVRLFGEDRR